MENTYSMDERKEYEEARKAYEKLSPDKRKLFASYIDMMGMILVMLLDAAGTKAQ